MFIAQRVLKTANGVFQPGDPVPEAKNWEFVTLRAHLDLEWLKEIPEVEDQPKETAAALSCPQCQKPFKNNRALSAHRLHHKK